MSADTAGVDLRGGQTPGGGREGAGADTVATVSLGLVEGFIGRVEEVIGAVDVGWRAGGDAATDRDGDAGRGEGRINRGSAGDLNEGADAFRDEQGVLVGGAGKEDDELFAAKARGEVIFTT